MAKNKLKNLVHYSCTFFLPLLILLICIFKTWSATGSVSHVYNTITFNIETGVRSFYDIFNLFDFFDIETKLSNLVVAFTGSGFNISIYLKCMFVWFGYILSFEIIHFSYDVITFLFRYIEEKLGGLS